MRSNIFSDNRYTLSLSLAKVTQRTTLSYLAYSILNTQREKEREKRGDRREKNYSAARVARRLRVALSITVWPESRAYESSNV